MPPIAERLADTAAWPWRNSSRYMVMPPSVIAPFTADQAIHA